MFRHVSFAAAHSYTIPIRTAFPFSLSPLIFLRRSVLKSFTNANNLYKQQGRRKNAETRLCRKLAGGDGAQEYGISIQAKACVPPQPNDCLTPDRHYLQRSAARSRSGERPADHRYRALFFSSCLVVISRINYGASPLH